MKAVIKRKIMAVDFKAMEKGDWDAYLDFIELAKEKLGSDFPQISYDAWLARNDGDEDKILPPKIKSMQQPLNQILYGPPGTGKTYNSIRRAVEIIDGEVGSDPKARFEELRKAGQIEFVTFHQSFSYEEFIEGLRPLIGDENGQVSYEIRAGILKKMALRAESSPAASERVLQRVPFEVAWSELQRLVQTGELTKIEGLTSASLHELIFEGEKLWGENIRSIKPNRHFSTTKNIQLKVWDAIPYNGVNSSRIAELGLANRSHGAFSAVIHNKLKSIAQKIKNNPQNPQNYVLIIDEINRGNISKILGELITLLEDDKRIGAENELRLTLPTSGETFALPPNLYLLGTMNTSDKSLAQLDVALRRRFDCEEMAPDLSLCDRLDGLQQVLERLNERLEWALDREHRLGHAYFMRVDSAAAFDAVFRSKVLPLLLEYFPHDFATLRAVLGEKNDGFLRVLTPPEGFNNGGKKYRWWFESGATNFSAFEQLKLNYGL